MVLIYHVSSILSASSAELDRVADHDVNGDGTGPIDSAINDPTLPPASTCELEVELSGSLPDDDFMDEDPSPLFEDI